MEIVSQEPTIIVVQDDNNKVWTYECQTGIVPTEHTVRRIRNKGQLVPTHESAPVRVRNFAIGAFLTRRYPPL